jgi:hypothetical protein
MGAVGVADRRPQHPAAILLDLVLDERVAIVGRGLELAAELRLRIVLTTGK